MSTWFIRRANISAGGSGPTPPTPRLPDDFKELAYIESDGNSYIDTGYVLVSNTDEMEMDCYIASVSASSRLCGARNTTTTKVYAIDVYNGKWRFGYYGASTAYTDVTAGRHVIKTELSSRIHLYVDGVSVGDKGITTTTTQYNCAVLAVRASSLYYSDSGVRCYEFKLKRNGTLLRHLIPAMRKADSVVGMYDLVGDAFLENAGTGTLGYGEL